MRNPPDSPMARKPRKGYFVHGHFVTAGSELDKELKAELKGTTDKSRTDMKKDSDHRQTVGEDLMSLRASLLKDLDLPEALVQSLATAKRLTDFGAKRRQLQHVGKLMRQLSDEDVVACEAALRAQHQGSPEEAAAMKGIENWRDQLIASDEALTKWLEAHPDTDVQALRSLIRQARKDAQKAKDKQTDATAPPPETAAEHPMPLAKAGKAYKDIFQIVRQALRARQGAANGQALADDRPDDED